jgi:hypothetical protein
VLNYSTLLALSTTVVLAFVGALGSAQAEERCAVADPTGTPLNVRLGPNGRITETLPNGLTVRIQQTASDHGKIWARITRDRDNGTLGYLDCNASVNAKPIRGFAFAWRDEIARTVEDFEECVSNCRNDSNCAAYVFFVSRKLCRLMTRSDASLEPNGDAISGYNMPAGSPAPEPSSSPTSKPPTATSDAPRHARNFPFSATNVLASW